MTWLYSIVFAGLMFSSQSGMVNTTSGSQQLPVLTETKAQQDETERFEQSYPLNANGRVAVSNVNGSITVESWEKNEVRLEAVKTADSKETLDEVQIKIESRPDSFSVETDYGNWQRQNNGSWRNRKVDVQFHLWVPRGAVLDEVETVNGSVTVSNFSNVTKISAVNGNVNASNLSGAANLSTVNGEVAADFNRLQTGSKINLETVNGKVNLTIPSDSSATLRADSVNGSITNDFGLPVRKGQYVGRDLYGRIGSGDVQVKLSSVNGTLNIGRKNDGRNLSPALNLLPQKSKDDQDIDDDDTDNKDESMVKMKHDVIKMKRDKETVVAMKEAQKEMIKIKPMKIEMPVIEVPKIEIDPVVMDKAAADIDMKAINEQLKTVTEAAKVVMPRYYEAGRSAMSRVQKRSDSIAVKGVPKVTVDAAGCEVKVRGWDKQEVQYTVIQYTDARDRTTFSSTENHSDSAVTIKVVNGDEAARNGDFKNEIRRVHVEVFVPRKSNLKIMTNGEIRVEGVSGDVELKGADEAINVRDVDGKMSLSNSDGLVRVVGFHGQLDATTNDGDVYLEGDFDKLTGKASDGSFFLTVSDKANASIFSNTDIETGDVEVKEAGENKWKLGTGEKNYTFHFGGGSLTLRCIHEIDSM